MYNTVGVYSTSPGLDQFYFYNVEYSQRLSENIDNVNIRSRYQFLIRNKRPLEE